MPVIENNAFWRSASDYIIVGPAQLSWPNNGNPVPPRRPDCSGSMGRQLAINFGKNVVVQTNTFNVSNGLMMDNWNDGETIQNEAGGGHMEEDTGAVTSATATSVTDNAKCGRRGDLLVDLFSQFVGAGDRQRRRRRPMASYHGANWQHLYGRQAIRRDPGCRRPFHGHQFPLTRTRSSAPIR